VHDYVTYTLWRQREEQLSHELEQQREVQERLHEQRLTTEQQHEVHVQHDSTTEVEPEFVEPEEASTALRESEAQLVSH